MQNKGVIRLFAIVFALACVYQLSFTYVASNVESKADDYAQNDPVKRQAYLDSVSNEVIYDIGIGEFTYADVKSKEINLGLDLKGGMNVIMEVSVKDILQKLSSDSPHPVLTEAIIATDQSAAQGQEDYLTGFFENFENLRKEQNLNISYGDPKLFGTKDMNEKVGFNASDDEVKAEISALVNAAVENVYTVLRARIDQFGVVQPNIQRLDNSGRILVELPGVKDPDRVKKLLQSTAELEFWNLYNGAELFGFMQAANEVLKDIVEDPNKDKAVSIDSTLADLNDFDNVDVTSEESSNDSSATDFLDSLNNLALGDSLNPDSSSLGQFNPLFKVLSPNVNEQGQSSGPVMGYAKVQDTATVNEYFSHPKVIRLLTGNARYTKFIWAAKANENGYVSLVAVRTDRNQNPVLTGDVITDARQDFDQSNTAVVTMTMNAQGTKQWGKVTKEAAGIPDDGGADNRAVAVVLDGYSYSSPMVNNEINNGRTEIRGDFTVQEAEDLANILKAGKLPVPARIIQADVVGPTLGKEAINSGLWSFVIALAVVMIYMIFYYSSAGAASVVALIVNMFFIFGVLASMGAVLTLPGIAGIVLTIGMAVDANVLIYERIREELNHGKGLKLAIKDGYNNAYSSIIDANVTTFLTGVILYAFGTGPIRGFATTLIIGILTSLFCGIFITRLIFEFRMDRKRNVSFFTGITKNAFKSFSIDFLSKKKISYMISGLIIAGGIVSLSTRGLNYGVDFDGGRSYQIRFDQQISSGDLESTLGELFKVDGRNVTPEVKLIGGDGKQVVITTNYKIDQTGTEVEDEIKGILFKGSSSFFANAPGEDAFFASAEDAEIGIVAERQVGPTIADDIRKSAVLAIIFSLIVIFLYILIRFSKWQFSIGAVAAAFHDVLVVLSVFSILYGFLPFSLEIDQAFIAAVLTVIGYSLNDTVVVFDRIREYLREKNKKTAMTSVVNDALNSTLSRTINTSVTTFFVLLVIFIFGGEANRGFMFALLIGVAVGTYSSLFIATPLMMDTLKKSDKGEEE